MTEEDDKMPAANEAVWRNGGSSPREVQCEIGSLSPARSSVEAATTPSRLDVMGKLILQPLLSGIQLL
jgi:hypothetical protein